MFLNDFTVKNDVNLLMAPIETSSSRAQHLLHSAQQHLHNGNGASAHAQNAVTTANITNHSSSSSSVSSMCGSSSSSSMAGTSNVSNGAVNDVASNTITTAATTATLLSHNNLGATNSINRATTTSPATTTDLNVTNDLHHLSAAAMTPPSEHASTPPSLLLPDTNLNSVAVAISANSDPMRSIQSVQSSPIAASTASIHSLVHSQLNQSSRSMHQQLHASNCMTSSIASDSPSSQTGSTSTPDGHHSTEMRGDAAAASTAALPVDSALSTAQSHQSHSHSQHLHSHPQHTQAGQLSQHFDYSNCSPNSLQPLTQHYATADPNKCNYSAYSSAASENYSRYLSGRGELLTPEGLPTYQSNHFSNSINAANFYNSQYGMLSQPYVTGKSFVPHLVCPQPIFFFFLATFHTTVLVSSRRLMQLRPQTPTRQVGCQRDTCKRIERHFNACPDQFVSNDCSPRTASIPKPKRLLAEARTARSRTDKPPNMFVSSMFFFRFRALHFL